MTPQNNLRDIRNLRMEFVEWLESKREVKTPHQMAGWWLKEMDSLLLSTLEEIKEGIEGEKKELKFQSNNIGDCIECLRTFEDCQCGGINQGLQTALSLITNKIESLK